MKLLRYVLCSPEAGVYLGSAMGLGFWSKWDPVGQPAAVTYPSPDAAFAEVLSWDRQPTTQIEARAVTVEVDGPPMDGEPVYATVGDCMAAGLPGWDPDFSAEAQA